MKRIIAMLFIIIIITMSLTVFASESAQDKMKLTSVPEMEVVYGDLTGNGQVELADAQIALRAALRIIDLEEGQYAAADVDGEEGLNLMDVQYILRYALRIINAFPIQDLQKPTAPTNSRVLVVYFSATDTTEKLAKYLSDGLGADLYEILPQIPYTSADLNYGDSSCRASMEKDDPNARPAISGSVANMKQYDIIFLGYPIWFGQAPKIISAFLESYDFSGKTIAPFCTSGSSGIGSSAVNIQNLASSAQWLEGRRFGGNSSRDEIIEWANGLGLDLNDMPSLPTPSQNTEPSYAPSEPVQPENSTQPNTSPKPETQPDDEKEESKYMLNIQIGEHLLTATLVQNSSTEALIEMLSAGAITINMRDYANMEKVGAFPASLPRNDKQINAEAGDLILYQGNSFVIYYDTNSWNFTRLGKIDNITPQELKEILGEGDVNAVLSLPLK